MDHSHMDHGHGDMDMGGSQCSMSMLFTWNYRNLCIVFEGWHIDSVWALILSMIAVAVMTAGYEGVREMSRQYDERTRRRLEDLPTEDGNVNERSSLLVPGKTVKEVERNSKVVKAVFYAAQVFYSFFIMLLFMTYNGWIMLSVSAGAFVGYLMFGGSSPTKDVSCH